VDSPSIVVTSSSEMFQVADTGYLQSPTWLPSKIFYAEHISMWCNCTSPERLCVHEILSQPSQELSFQR